MREPRSSVSTSLKLRYAMGGSAEGAIVWAFNGFNFVIYTIIFNMPGTLVGLAVFLSILLDAVSDPLVGYLSDRWRSRWGRRHSFIYFASVPLGACIFCIYSPPEILLASSDEVWSLFGYEASPVQWALGLWLFVFAALLKFFLTCYHLPHLALGSELSDDYLERTRIFRYNALFSFSGGASLSFLFYSYFFTSGPQSGLDTSYFAACVAIFGAVIVFLTAFLTREQIPLLMEAPDNLPKITASDFFKEASVVFQNRNYMMLFYGLLCLSSMIGVRETLSANMGLYYWELRPDQLRWMPLFTIAAYFIAVVLVAPMNKYFEKGGTMRIVVAISALAAALPVILRTLDFLPPNGATFIFVMYGMSAFAYYGGLAILTTSVYSAIGDVVDEQELLSGKRQEGVFYAVRTFFAKLANALGHLLAGIAIDVVGFPPGAVVGEVERSILIELGLFEGVIATLPVLGAVYFYGRYQIDKKRHVDIQEALIVARSKY